MTHSSYLLIITLVIPLSLVILKKIRIDVASLLIVCSLGIMQALGLPILGSPNAPQEAVKAISGFAQPVIITLIALFIITYSLERSGIPRWFAHRILKLGGGKINLYIALFALISAGLSLFMNTLAACQCITAANRNGVCQDHEYQTQQASDSGCLWNFTRWQRHLIFHRKHDHQ